MRLAFMDASLDASVPMLLHNGMLGWSSSTGQVVGLGINLAHIVIVSDTSGVREKRVFTLNSTILCASDLHSYVHRLSICPVLRKPELSVLEGTFSSGLSLW